MSECEYSTNPIRPNDDNRNVIGGPGIKEGGVYGMEGEREGNKEETILAQEQEQNEEEEE